MSTYQILEEAAHKFGNSPAIIDDHGTLSFNELFAEAEKLRSYFAAAHITPGIGVTLKAPNGRAFVVGLFALSGCGAVVMPTLASPDEKWNIHVLVSAGSVSGSPCGDIWKIKWFDRSRCERFAEEIPDAAFLRPTSGTTGVSKGVILSHASVVARVEATRTALQLSPQDRILWVLPMAHHFIASIITYIHTGCCCIVCRDSSAATIMSNGNEHGATLLYASPAQYTDLLSSSGELNIARAFCTSTVLAPHIGTAFEKRFGRPLRQLYGMIEIGIPLGNLSTPALAPHSVGHALLPYQAQIQDEQGATLPFNYAGELAFKGPGLFDGYLQPLRRREDLIRNGWFLSGDIAIQREDGSFEIRGRKSSTIETSATVVYPEEVERVLNAHPAIQQARVFGITDKALGEKVSAEIVLNGSAPITNREIIEFCQGTLSDAQVPHEIRFVKNLRFTESGKISRRDIP
jgi:long-chain acyl-CoA synthetase